MAYATVQDLVDSGVLGYAGGPPANAQVLLDRASDDVDRAINSAVYPVDVDGLPTDAAVTVAVRRATLAQVAYQLEQGNANGIRHGLQSGVPSGASAGSVELSRGQSAGGSTADAPWLGDQAEWILRSAGLRGQAPQTYTWPRYP
jgi:hypothetical protein